MFHFAMAVKSTSPFIAVLLSTEVSSIIASFQYGNYKDLRELQPKLIPIFKRHYELSFIQQHMQHFHNVLQPWLDTYGLARLRKFLAFSTQFVLVMVQYAAYSGRMDLIAILHSSVDLRSFPDPLVDLAAINGHTEMAKFMQSIGHPGKSSLGILWAAKHGHLTTLKCLMEQDALQEITRASAIKLAMQSGHLSIVQYLESNRDLAASASDPSTDSSRLEPKETPPALNSSSETLNKT
ncbi:hypothetical protein LEN26_007062 [Aphanomyces euteiches]|nr:hypothetical protein LEN26_007062 [Aphanomyces euteiches]